RLDGGGRVSGSPRRHCRGRIEAADRDLCPDAGPAVLHGVIAVAALKRSSWSGAPRWRIRSPRRHCRGRIEARFLLGWPARTARHVLHGVIAVAALKLASQGGVARDASGFSTASLPWPH